jgi:hypothetical protein
MPEQLDGLGWLLKFVTQIPKATQHQGNAIKIQDCNKLWRIQRRQINSPVGCAVWIPLGKPVAEWQGSVAGLLCTLGSQ